MTIAPSHRDRQETGMAGGKAGTHCGGRQSPFPTVKG